MNQIALLELQIIDSEIDRLNSELTGLEERRVLEAKLKEIESLEKLDSHQAQLWKTEKAQEKKVEDSIKDLTAKIEREEKRLYGGGIQSPKELVGIEQELASLKPRREADETVWLEKTERLEELSRNRAVLDERLQRVRAEAEAARSVYEARAAEIQDRLTGARSRRDEAVKLVSPDILKLYDRLRHEKMGLAVAQLDGSTCGGCHTELPAQELAQMPDDGTLARCPHCRRILLSGAT
jgi:uncharacterized protein